MTKAKGKKKRKNGKRKVILRTIHGSFPFELQRYKIESGETDYLRLTESEPISDKLKATIFYYANKLSYREVAILINKMCGCEQFSAQAIKDIVVKEAVKTSQKELKQIEAMQLTLPFINTNFDIYDSETEEVLIFEDAIGVKKQKERRASKPSLNNENSVESNNTTEAASKTTEDEGKRIYTDVLLLQTPNKEYEYITAGADSNGGELYSLELAAQAAISKHYGKKASINVVAITDGARSIRLNLERIFGVCITIILDWYHLKKKVFELMSMIAFNKEEKKRIAHVLLGCLWLGQVDEAISFLKSMDKVRNKTKHEELITYLEKHKHEIINYKRRKEAGKDIGSGRCEKAVDQVIGNRQKKKGMSWSKKGSKALAILKAEQLNKKIAA